ncbi:MAG: toll/interleukin-1 receptor domain-containing protein [Bacteroidota bacterium]
MKLKLFFSYGRDDGNAKIARRLVSYLKKISSIILYWDQELIPGDQWEPIVLQEAREADIFVFLVSNHSCASAYCKKELEVYAEGKLVPVIIPIFLEECRGVQLAERFRSTLHCLPANPKTGTGLSAIINWLEPEGMLSKVYDQISSKVRLVATRLLDQEIQTESVPPLQAAPLVEPTFDDVLTQYLAFFEQTPDDLGTFSNLSVSLPYYHEREHIVFSPCFYDERSDSFLVKEGLFTRYETYGSELPLLYLLPTGIWQQKSNSRDYALKIPQDQVQKAINELKKEIKNYDSSSQIHIILLDLLRHTLDF